MHDIRITGRLNSDKVNLHAQDPWHSLHMPEKASGTEVVVAMENA